MTCAVTSFNFQYLPRLTGLIGLQKGFRKFRLEYEGLEMFDCIALEVISRSLARATPTRFVNNR